MTKKIAIVSNTSWYIFNFRMNLINGLISKGYEVIAIAPHDEYSNKLKESGINKFIELKIESGGINPFEDIHTLYRLYKIYQGEKPDIVFHFTPKPNIYGTIAANKLQIPAVNNISGLGRIFINRTIITHIVKILYRYSQKRATKVFFQNKDDLALFLSENLIQEQKCDVLPGSGVNIQQFIPKVLVKKDSTFRFILIARMLWDKGVGEYVEAARILKTKYSHLEFQLLGFLDVQNPSAISSGKMNEWVNQGLVNYLGTTDRVGDFLEKADCVVLPSYREGTPRSLLEAASMAKPIITTNSVGCKEVVDDGINGFLCKVKDATDLAEKMEQMILLNEDERLEMGKRGREKMIREFDEKIVIQKYLDTVGEIIEKQNNKHAERK